jgi:hypothetical protein
MKECLRCKKTFEPKKPKAKFCSDKCRVYYAREQSTGMPIVPKKAKPVVASKKQVKAEAIIIKDVPEVVIPTPSIAALNMIISNAPTPKGLHEKSNQTKIAEYEEELKHLGNSSAAAMRRKYIQKQIQILKR